MGNCFALEFFCLGVFFRVWVSVKNLQLPIFLRQTWRRQTRIARFPVRSREGTEEGQRWLPDALAQLWGNPRGPLVRPLPLLSMLAYESGAHVGRLRPEVPRILECQGWECTLLGPPVVQERKREGTTEVTRSPTLQSPHREPIASLCSAGDRESQPPAAITPKAGCDLTAHLSGVC